MADIGKQFEFEFTKQCEDTPGLVLTRLHDVNGKFKDVDNPCDFILYKYPNVYYLELKARQGHLLNFKSGIRPNQWEGLLDYSYIEGTYAGILIWFYEHHKTYFINIKTLEKLRKSGKKSITIDDCERLGVLFDGRLKRKFTAYDINKNLDKIKSSKY